MRYVDLCRYRPIFVAKDKTVFEEIRCNELYFSRLDCVNDPTEGSLDYYWEGDGPIWKNLIRNYCFSLFVCAMRIDIDDKCNVDWRWANTRFTPAMAPTRAMKCDFENIYAQFTRDLDTNSIIGCIMNQKTVRNDNVFFVLLLCHHAFLQHLKCRYAWLIGASTLEYGKISELMVRFKDVIENETVSAYEILGSIFKMYASQIHLMEATETKRQHTVTDNRIRFVLFFPEYYLTALINSLFPEHFIACFSDNATNELMWSHYADEHRGLCLVFRLVNDDEKTYINLEDDKRIEISKVNYDNTITQINVFEYLGDLPQRFLKDDWLVHDGQISSLGATYEDSDSYRRRYWEISQNKVTRKSTIWDSEKEYRAIRNDWMNKERFSNCTRYNMDQLTGVIFGCCMKTEDKVEVMRVLDERLTGEQKQNFHFCAASYEGGCAPQLVIRKLELLKFS